MMVKRFCTAAILCLLVPAIHAASLSDARELELRSVSITQLFFDPSGTTLYAITDAGDLLSASIDTFDWRKLGDHVDSCAIDAPTGRLWCKRFGGPEANGEIWSLGTDGSWTLNTTWGYFATTAVAGADGVLLAVGGYPPHIWRSLDEGQTWAVIADATGLPDYLSVYSITMRPGHPENIFLHDGNGMLISTDAGKSWKKAVLKQGTYSYSFAGRPIVFDPRDPSILAGLYGRMFVFSRNGGLNWDKVTVTGIPPLCYTPDYCTTDQLFKAIAFAPDGNLYAATTAGLYVSTNRGAFWRRIVLSPEPIMHAIAASGNLIAIGDASPGLLISRDAAATWTSVPTALSSKVDACAVDPSDARRVYASASNVFFASDNGGSSWHETHGNLEYVRDALQEISVDPHNPDHIVAVAEESPAISTDGGANWSFEYGPIHGVMDPVGAKIFSVDWTTSSYYLVSRRGLHRKRFTDQGWTTLGAGIIDAARTNAFLVDPSDPQTLYIGMSDYGVFASRDDGATWTGQSTGFIWPDGFNVYSLAADSKTGRIFAGTSRGIYVSDDQARHWRLYSSVPAWPKQQLVFDTNTGMLFASATTGEESVLWTISADGATADRVSLPFDEVIVRLRLGGDGHRLLVLTQSGRLFSFAVRSRTVRRR